MHDGGFFEPDGDALMPIPEARGPWAEDMMHGRLLAGLAAWAIDRDHGDPRSFLLGSPSISSSHRP